MLPKNQLEQSLGSLVGRTAKLMTNALLTKFRAAGHEMGMDHWLILVHLWHQDGRNQQDLGHILGRNKTTMTRAINWLEEENMVVRVSDQQDRRLKRIFLTHKGKNTRTDMEPFMQEVIKEATDGVPPKDLETCKQVLAHVFDNLRLYI
ncbi:MAG: MarR family winged helix-turn-helix transcriptional regulator [Bacteroidota bacterium]